MNALKTRVALVALLVSVGIADAQTKTVSIGDTLVTIPALPSSMHNGDAVALTMRPEAVALSNGAEVILDRDAPSNQGLPILE